MAQGESGDCKQVNHPHAAPGRWIGQWYVLESDNFEIRCEKTAAPAKALAEQAESLRDNLASKWLGKPSADRWHPACQIFLYASKRTYVGAVGPGSERTAGSSLVNVEKGQVTGRRVDLLGDDAEFPSAALPHELTHVLLRDRFVSTAPPRWADEGMATLADTEAKQGRHRKDLMAALADGTTFHPANLLVMDDYPRPYRLVRSMARACRDKIPGRASVRKSLWTSWSELNKWVTTLRFNPATESTEHASSTASGDKKSTPFSLPRIASTEAFRLFIYNK